LAGRRTGTASSALGERFYVIFWRISRCFQPMRPMPRKRIRMLITGLAMAFVGPAVGFCIYFAALIYAEQPGASSNPLEVLADIQRLPGRLALAALPLGLGFLCGAAGVLVSLSSLIIHFLGKETEVRTNPFSSPPPPNASSTQPASPPIADDSRHMPSFRQS